MKTTKAQFLTLTSLLYGFFFALLFAGLIALVFIGLANDNPPTTISGNDSADLARLDITGDMNTTYGKIEESMNKQNSSGISGALSQADLALSTSTGIAKATFDTPITSGRIVTTGVNRWGLSPGFIILAFCGIFTFIILLFIGLALRAV